uniref:Uncharacterized protein n=1 Tax=Caenorhabditis japonica TaxID=281687 RepID=A0A8R1ID70_CAEJA
MDFNDERGAKPKFKIPTTLCRSRMSRSKKKFDASFHGETEKMDFLYDPTTSTHDKPHVTDSEVQEEPEYSESEHEEQCEQEELEQYQFSDEESCDKTATLLQPIQLTKRTGSEVQQHVFDHLTETIHHDGSPTLSSAAPFERLNQTLGRSTNSYTTRTVLDMAKRFTSIQNCIVQCTLSVAKHDSPVSFPRTLNAVASFSPEVDFRYSSDDFSLSKDEKDALKAIPNVKLFKTSAFVGVKKYSIRRVSEDRLAQTCYVCYEGSDRIEFGSVERIFEDESNKTFALIQHFETLDPFAYLANWPDNDNNFTWMCDSLNSFFRQIVDTNFSVIDISRLKGYCSVLEFDSQSYVSRF